MATKSYRKKRKGGKKKRKMTKLTRMIGKPTSTVEVKYKDTAIALYAQSNSAINTEYLSGILQGTRSRDRIGDKVIIKSVDVDGWFRTNPDATYDHTQTVKWVVFCDKEPCGTAKPYMYGTGGTTGTTGPNCVYDSALTSDAGYPILPLNYSTMERFVIMASDVIDMQQYGGQGYTGAYWAGNAHHIRRHIKCNIEVRYLNPGNTFVDQVSNCIYFGLLGTEPAGQGDSLFNGIARLRFIDS